MKRAAAPINESTQSAKRAKQDALEYKLNALKSHSLATLDDVIAATHLAESLVGATTDRRPYGELYEKFTYEFRFPTQGLPYLNKRLYLHVTTFEQLEDWYNPRIAVFETLERTHTNDNDQAWIACYKHLFVHPDTWFWEATTTWDACCKDMESLRAYVADMRSRKAYRDSVSKGGAGAALIATLERCMQGTSFPPHALIMEDSSIVALLKTPIPNNGPCWPGQREIVPWEMHNLLHAPKQCFAGPHSINWGTWSHLMSTYAVTDLYEAILIWILHAFKRNYGSYEAQLFIELLAATGHREKLVRYLRDHRCKTYGDRETNWGTWLPSKPEKMDRLLNNLVQWPTDAYHISYRAGRGAIVYWSVLDCGDTYKFCPEEQNPVFQVARPLDNPYH